MTTACAFSASVPTLPFSVRTWLGRRSSRAQPRKTKGAAEYRVPQRPKNRQRLTGQSDLGDLAISRTGLKLRRYTVFLRHRSQSKEVRVAEFSSHTPGTFSWV